MNCGILSWKKLGEFIASDRAPAPRPQTSPSVTGNIINRRVGASEISTTITNFNIHEIKNHTNNSYITTTDSASVRGQHVSSTSPLENYNFVTEAVSRNPSTVTAQRTHMSAIQVDKEVLTNTLFTANSTSTVKQKESTKRIKGKQPAATTAQLGKF